MSQQDKMRVEINGTVYVVSTFYSEDEDEDETVIDKIARLVRTDEAISKKAAV